MIRRYVVVPGTGSLCSDPTPPPHEGHWWEPGAPFVKFMAMHGLLSHDEPFEWSGDLDGAFSWLPWKWFRSRKHNDWKAGGSALRYYLQGVDYNNRNLIAHSHGLQVALHAAAGTSWRMPQRIRRLISIGSPVRADNFELANRARPNIGKWIHIYDPTGEDDIQILGQVGDGRVSLNRRYPMADENLAIAGVGHSELLRDPKQFRYWRSQGLIDFLRF